MATSKKLNAKDIKEVVDHYLDYPYPLRNPEDERTRLLQIHGENLNEINHWVFKGKQSFNDGFRVLVAGGGTGDCSTYSAEQLKNKNAEVVYLDFSKNSMEIAKKRAEIRGLKNITFINDSIFNIPDLNLGKFDYINCSGVLHHLSSPPEGLAILQQSLKPEGGMGLMVYAKYGRTAVYQLQDLMKMVNDGVSNRGEEVKNAKIMLNSLPPTNWYMRSQDLISDIQTYGDVGIYDLLLHKQDRCYSIPELYEFIENAGLNFVEFSETQPRLTLKLENFVRDTEMLAKLKALPIVKQHTIAELIAGNIIKHTFYASNVKNSVADLTDLNNVPFFFGITGIAAEMCNYIENNTIPKGSNVSITINSVWVKQGINIALPVSDLTLPLFKVMRNEPQTLSLREIFDEINKERKKKASDKELIEEVQRIFTIFIDAGVLMLRDKSLPAL